MQEKFLVNFPDFFPKKRFNGAALSFVFPDERFHFHQGFAEFFYQICSGFDATVVVFVMEFHVSDGVLYSYFLLGHHVVVVMLL